MKKRKTFALLATALLLLITLAAAFHVHMDCGAPCFICLVRDSIIQVAAILLSSCAVLLASSKFRLNFFNKGTRTDKTFPLRC